jgi:hypothetical protein
MSVCSIGKRRWFATSSFSSNNCYEITCSSSSVLDGITVKRLATTCRPRIGNHLIYLNDYVYDIGGTEKNCLTKIVESISLKDLEGCWIQ